MYLVAFPSGGCWLYGYMLSFLLKESGKTSLGLDTIWRYKLWTSPQMPDFHFPPITSRSRTWWGTPASNLFSWQTQEGTMFSHVRSRKMFSVLPWKEVEWGVDHCITATHSPCLLSNLMTLSYKPIVKCCFFFFFFTRQILKIPKDKPENICNLEYEIRTIGSPEYS